MTIHTPAHTPLQPTHLVCSGGSYRGASIIGALEILDKHNYLSHITTYSGTSIGSLICAFLAMNYDVKELNIFTKSNQFPCTKFYLFMLIRLLWYGGLNNNQDIIKYLEKGLEQKNLSKNITFQQLYEQTGKVLNVYTTSILTQSLQIFNHIETPDYKITLAVAASCAIPLLRIPLRYNGKLLVDGALVKNYPIFKDTDPKTTIGININLNKPKKLEYLYEWLWTIDLINVIIGSVYTLFSVANSLSLPNNYKEYTIEIDFFDTYDSTLSLRAISDERVKQLTDSGRRRAIDFIQR